MKGAFLAVATAATVVSFKVGLDANPAGSRALARDGETYAPHWERWAAHEEAYLDRHDPRAAADLVVRLPSA